MARENQEGRGNTPSATATATATATVANAAAQRSGSAAAAAAKQPINAARGADGQSVLKRSSSSLLSYDFFFFSFLFEMNSMMCGDPGISAFPEGDNIFSWKGTIDGGAGTVYEGMVKFESPCFHPNVDLCGNICLDILQDKWSSAYDVRTILLSVQSLLGEPNNDSPLNTQAAAMWANQEEFRKMLEKHYKPAS
uniref:UBC core domain-containing protein n=1 Tax=Ananas comosus var. bracteatus TaxID=296719 RepID=A0A6V7PRT1_ANACO|nr:unnamed protein product [Ananas comosus var. bracteatus]